MTILSWLVIVCLITSGNGDNSDSIEEGDLSIDDSVLVSQATSSPGNGDCISKHSLCDFWAKGGECVASRKFMSDYCAGSCDPQCKGKSKVNDESVECKNYIQYCRFWASQGECEKNPTYMIWQCPKECHPKCSKGGSSSNETDSSSKKGSDSNAPQAKFLIKKVGGGSQNDRQSGNRTAAVERNSKSKETSFGNRIVLPRRRIRPESDLKSPRTSNAKIQGKTVTVKKVTGIPKVIVTTSAAIVTKTTRQPSTSSRKATTSAWKRTTRKQSAVSKNRSAFTLQTVTAHEGFSPVVPVHMAFTDDQLQSNSKKQLKQSSTKINRVKVKTYKLRHRLVQQSNEKSVQKASEPGLQPQQSEDDQRQHLLKEKE